MATLWSMTARFASPGVSSSGIRGALLIREEVGAQVRVALGHHHEYDSLTDWPKPSRLGL